MTERDAIAALIGLPKEQLALKRAREFFSTVEKAIMEGKEVEVSISHDLEDSDPATGKDLMSFTYSFTFTDDWRPRH
jgi:hypothetical protein